jgi:hypothetical protein
MTREELGAAAVSDLQPARSPPPRRKREIVACRSPISSRVCADGGRRLRSARIASRIARAIASSLSSSCAPT